MNRLVTGTLAIVATLALPASAQIGNIVVTNAASFEPGLPDRGSLGTIFCTGLAVDGVVRADHFPLPKTLAGVTVTVGGTPAPLLAVANLGAYQQINFQVPQTVAVNPDVTAQVIVTQNGVSGSASPTLRGNSPGAFFRVLQGDKPYGIPYGIFQHVSDYSLVTTENPAVAGETVIAYLTGLPPATPTVPDGEPAPASPLSVVPQPYTRNFVEYFSIYVGTLLNPLDFSTRVSSPISFIGFSPGSVGLYQVNFIPAPSTVTGLQAVQLVETYCGAISGDCRSRPLANSIGAPVLIPVR